MKFFWIVFLCFSFSTAQAYEIGTHARITNAAYNRFISDNPNFITDMGLNRSNPIEPIGEKYFDVSGSNIFERGAYPYEMELMPNREFDQFQMQGWLMRGAIREDDLGIVLFHNYGDDPHDDPYGNFWRVLNHFYDPVNDLPITLGSLTSTAFSTITGDGTNFKRAPEWAIGSTSPFTTPLVPDGSRRNHYTIVDAREAMYRAVTGLDSNGNIVASTDEQQKKYWATTFRALGDTLHLVQDMGQPQHTRNDPHAGVAGLGETSIYEAYVDKRALGKTYTTAIGNIITPSPLNYSGYPIIPAFDDYGSYYSTRSEDIVNRKGLADYSNRSFFTAGKNADSTAYNYPSNFRTGTQSSNVVWYGDGSPGPILYYLGNLPDALTGQTDFNVPLATASLWDDLLGQLSFQPKYNLTKANYDAMADLLIPRAVAYSTGLLEYFFRGKMAISLPIEGIYAIADHSPGIGFTKIKVGLANTTPDQTVGDIVKPQAMNGGRLIAVARYHTNTCYKPDLTGEWGAPGVDGKTCYDPVQKVTTSSSVLDVNGTAVTSATLSQSPQTFQFIFSQPIPFGVSDLSIQIVYRGNLGSEADAVVVATKNISEPTYYTTHNTTDYIMCISNVYYNNNEDGSFSTAEQTALINAGVDPSQPNIQQAYGPTNVTSLSIQFGNQPLTFTGGYLTNYVAKAAMLSPGQFRRLAILGNISEPLNSIVTSSFFPGQLNIPSIQEEFLSYFNPPNYNPNPQTSIIDKVRGILGWGEFFFIQQVQACPSSDFLQVLNTTPTHLQTSTPLPWDEIKF